MPGSGSSHVGRIAQALVQGSCLCLGLMAHPASAGLPLAAPDTLVNVCAATDGVMPANVVVRAPFQAVVRDLLAFSPTFRAQCQRVAAAPHLHVVMRLDQLSQGHAFGARTTFTYGPAGEVTAVIQFVAGRNYAPIVGHEFEHVLEQLDCWHLPRMAADGAGVHEIEPGIYETQRAIEAGHRVEAEMFGRRRTAPVTAPETH